MNPAVRRGAAVLLLCLAPTLPAWADKPAVGAAVFKSFDNTDRSAKLLAQLDALARKGNPEAQFRRGNLAVEQGHREEALQWYRRAAFQGHQNAKLRVLVAYRSGLPLAGDEQSQLTRIDPTKAKPWELDDLGLHYQYGRLVQKDERRAETLFRQAADQGDAHGMALLGRLYGQAADKQIKDAEKEELWYQRAVAAGDPLAMSNLGVNYEKTADKKGQAPTLARRAADLDYTAAINNLAVYHYYGELADKDRDRAVALWRRSAELGDDDAKLRLGDILTEGAGNDREALRQAAEWYLAPHYEADPTPSLRLAKLIEDRGMEFPKARLAASVKLAADSCLARNNLPACHATAVLAKAVGDADICFQAATVERKSNDINAWMKDGGSICAFMLRPMTTGDYVTYVQGGRKLDGDRLGDPRLDYSREQVVVEILRQVQAALPASEGETRATLGSQIQMIYKLKIAPLAPDYEEKQAALNRKAKYYAEEWQPPAFNCRTPSLPPTNASERQVEAANRSLHAFHDCVNDWYDAVHEGDIRAIIGDSDVFDKLDDDGFNRMKKSLTAAASRVKATADRVAAAVEQRNQDVDRLDDEADARQRQREFNAILQQNQRVLDSMNSSIPARQPYVLPGMP